MSEPGVSAAPAPAGRAVQYLCICADDYGLGAGVNAAVLDLIDRRVVTATGCLVLRDAWRSGAAALRSMGPARADVGLHLDLTTPAAANGEEPGLLPLLLRTGARAVSRHALRQAIAEQLNRFESAMDRAPAFVDGHRHVHQFAVVRDALLDELQARYGRAAPWVRGTRPRAGHGVATGKAQLIHALGGRALVRGAARRGVPVSGALLGAYDFRGGAGAYRRRLRAWLGAARTGDVLMCHPSRGDGAAVPHDAARIDEYKVLAALPLPWVAPAGGLVVPARWRGPAGVDGR